MRRAIARIHGAPFADETSANVKLAEIKRKRDQIAQALQLRFDSADAPAPEGAKQDMWLLSSAGDLNLLTQSPNPRRASYFYKKAAAVGGDFVLDSARRQLVMLTQIGVLNPQIEEVLKAFPPESARFQTLLLTGSPRASGWMEREDDLSSGSKSDHLNPSKFIAIFAGEN